MKLNTNSYNGIRIIDSMNLSVPKNRKFLNIIPLLIISFLGIWGTVFSYITMFDITINSTLINFCTILFFVILSIYTSTNISFFFIANIDNLYSYLV